MMENTYDSRSDTLTHIKRVNELLINAATELLQRAKVHDESKLHSPEKEWFDKATERLKNLEFGSEEYKQSLKELEPALNHHYEHNSHHPQHYKEGINEMDLFDLLEMLLDWKAAGERTAGGNIFKSIAVNTSRFRISDQLASILINTARKYLK